MEFGRVRGLRWRWRGDHIILQPVSERLVTRERAVAAAIIKMQTGIPYAGALGIQLASEPKEYISVTADFDVKPAADRVRMEFLPVP